MSRFLFASFATFVFVAPACAADFPVKAPPVAAYDWSGWSFGGNIGYGWGANSGRDVTFVDGNSLGVADYFALGGNVMPNIAQRGVIGGLQAGYDWMIAPFWVVGVVADIQASSMKSSATATVKPCTTCVISAQTNRVETDWFGTVRGKLGWANDHWLLYATGGLAYGQVKTSGVWNAAHVLNYAGSVSATRVGWALGAGVDYGVTRNWIVGVEYLYVDLGHTSYTDVSTDGLAPLTTFTINNRVAANIVRATLGYKF